MKVRTEEEQDLVDLEDNVCHVPVKNPGSVDSDVKKKINVLLQAYISRQQPRTHSLISDMNYIQQNAGRLARYIFEIAVRRGWAVAASHAHRLSKVTPLVYFIGTIRTLLSSIRGVCLFDV
ncbi:unnamed protein product [Dibothriocephalus latus]|uniref:SEC63 domain-containing protein n=1 Tax=Dibothriocephalus latus TaxID=60516 RepID=A0A3P7RAV6_DIBLA|nr:unnamed protein product [Dibothriocephalus latus]